MSKKPISCYLGLHPSSGSGDDGCASKISPGIFNFFDEKSANYSAQSLINCEYTVMLSPHLLLIAIGPNCKSVGLIWTSDNTGNQTQPSWRQNQWAEVTHSKVRANGASNFKLENQNYMWLQGSSITKKTATKQIKDFEFKATVISGAKPVCLISCATDHKATRDLQIITGGICNITDREGPYASYKEHSTRPISETRRTFGNILVFCYAPSASIYK